MASGTAEGEDKEAKVYQNEVDFAFFVVNFNYTRDQYDNITPTEKAFIMKAWETKLISDSTHERNSNFNAINNALRKKGSRFIDLWTKPREKHDMEIIQEQLEIIENVEKEGKGWIDKIYKANGIRKKKKGSEE